MRKGLWRSGRPQSHIEYTGIFAMMSWRPQNSPYILSRTKAHALIPLPHSARPGWAEAAPIAESDLATKQLFGDAQYAVAKVESAIVALDADTGPLSERINAAWTDGSRQLGRDTIPRSWPEVRETYESIRNRVAKSGHLLDQFIAAMAVPIWSL